MRKYKKKTAHCQLCYKSLGLLIYLEGIYCCHACIKNCVVNELRRRKESREDMS
jgi:hypothetical protein